MGQESSNMLQRTQNGETVFTNAVSSIDNIKSKSNNKLVSNNNYINYATIDSEIPISLRLVHSFLYDAQRYLRYYQLAIDVYIVAKC